MQDAGEVDECWWVEFGAGYLRRLRMGERTENKDAEEQAAYVMSQIQLPLS